MLIMHIILVNLLCMLQNKTRKHKVYRIPKPWTSDSINANLPIFQVGYTKFSVSENKSSFSFSNLQSTLVISTSVISNNRLSRRENLIPVLT